MYFMILTESNSTRSHISGVTLIGVPSEVYYFGTQYLLISIVNVIVIVIVLCIYLPVFYELQYPSIYEVCNDKIIH